MVSVDAIIAIMVFLVMVAWGVVYFGSFSPEGEDNFEYVMGVAHTRILENLTTTMHKVPVKHYSVGSGSDYVFFFDFTWPSGKNSTRVFGSGGDEKPCTINNTRVYFQSDVAAGDNMFYIQFVEDDSIPIRCSGSFNDSDSTRLSPMSSQKATVFLLSHIQEMNNTDYGIFRNGIGLDRNFRVEINITGSETLYGLPTPLISNVYNKEINSIIEETGEKVNARIMVW